MPTNRGQHWQIVLLTCRDPATDFRLPLAEELNALGHDVFYIYLKRRPLLVRMGSEETRREFSLVEFLKFMPRQFRTTRPLLFFNSTNLVFPVLSIMLRVLCGGVWVLDLHDDLLYGKRGFARLKARIAQRMLVAGADKMVHAAPTLKELFPSSIHLGNASTMTALERPAPDFQKVLILASIDERLDFEFLTKTARLNPDISFDIYGQIAGNDTAIRTRVDEAAAHIPNVKYLGPYVNSDLPHILAEYLITFAPYAIKSRLTYYIDPLRYYHCLNSGMEVISTAIPKANDFGEVLHLVQAPAEIGPLVRQLADGETARRNHGSTSATHNWRKRAERLMCIVSGNAISGENA
jgi:hypothetical protein